MIPRGVEVFVGLDPIDLGWGFERLSGIVQERIGRGVRSGALFLFCGRRREAKVEPRRHQHIDMPKPVLDVHEIRMHAGDCATRTAPTKLAGQLRTACRSKSARHRLGAPIPSPWHQPWHQASWRCSSERRASP